MTLTLTLNAGTGPDHLGKNTIAMLNLRYPSPYCTVTLTQRGTSQIGPGGGGGGLQKGFQTPSPYFSVHLGLFWQCLEVISGVQ